MTAQAARVEAAEVVLPCVELRETLAFFTGRLGFSIEAIHPADDPTVAVLSAYGVRIRLERGAPGPVGRLRLSCEDPAAFAGGATTLTAPNGTRIDLVPWDPPVVLPPLRPSFVVSRSGEASWVEGRAGMRYRDLIPDRLGGRFIASHIQIPAGGPVPDYVHFHVVRFQMIYCAKGWVRVVYEDQGMPFVLNAGDCVLQPPRIRHRVLESSPGVEVIEIGCPADHQTFADNELSLPTQGVRPDRDFGGQRFVRHEAVAATWGRGRDDGFEARDLGIAVATGGVASARVVRSRPEAVTEARHHDGELCFVFVLAGCVTLACEGRDRQRLAEGDAFVVPPRLRYALAETSADLELLEVMAPALA
jgi:quercetin dioxygenase-like cupin family protein